MRIQIVSQSAENIVECEVNAAEQLFCDAVSNVLGSSEIEVLIDDYDNVIYDTFTVNVIRDPNKRTNSRDYTRTGIVVDQLRVTDLEGFDDEMLVHVRLNNDGNVNFDDVKVTATFPELGLYAVAGPVEMNRGDTETFTLYVPKYGMYIADGYYTARLVVSTETGYKRILHREVYISQDTESCQQCGGIY